MELKFTSEEEVRNRAKLPSLQKLRPVV